MNTWKCSMLGASMLALSAGWAAAAPAVVLDYLNLRFGPGYNYPIIEVIPAGWMVEAGGCFDGWCQVNVNGTPGYVDAAYLASPTAPAIAYGASPYYGPYGLYDSRYTNWAYPYRVYSGLRYDPTVAYYYGYYDAPYLGSIAGAYAEARDAKMTPDRRPSDRVGHAAVARNNGAMPLHAAKPTSSSSSTGVAVAAVHPNRTDKSPPH
jgi:uncharacterized protein YraI